MDIFRDPNCSANLMILAKTNESKLCNSPSVTRSLYILNGFPYELGNVGYSDRQINVLQSSDIGCYNYE